MWLYISDICINANIGLRKVHKSCVFICVHMCRRCVHHSSIYEHVCIFQGTYDYVWCQGWLQTDRGILEVKVWYWELQVRVALDYAPWIGKSLSWARNPLTNTVTHSQQRSENKVSPKNCLACNLLFRQGVHLVCFKLRQGTKCLVNSQISHWSCLPGTCILNRSCTASESHVNKQANKTWHGYSEENRLL